VGEKQGMFEISSYQTTTKYNNSVLDRRVLDNHSKSKTKNKKLGIRNKMRVKESNESFETSSHKSKRRAKHK